MKLWNFRFIRLMYVLLLAVLTVTILFFYVQKAESLQNVIEEWMNNGALVVDVRTRIEYAEWHYKDSLNIPLNELEMNISLFGNTENFIIVYCRRGNRSGAAKSILEKHGYKNVINGGGLEEMKSLE